MRDSTHPTSIKRSPALLARKGALAGVVIVVAVIAGTACSEDADPCSNTSSCLPGTSGSSGEAGAGDSGGSSGGSQAHGGTSGDGGAGNATSGGSGSGTAGAGSGSGGDAGDSGAAGAGGAGPMPCDDSLSPRDEACLVTDEYAVFVSPAGDDTGAGTQDAPFATLTKAVEAAAASDKSVLVCNATYNEHVSIAAGARVYGGFSCTDWSAAAAAKPLIKPTSTGPALKIENVTDPVLIDSVSFEVGDAVAAGETALTAIVNASTSVTLRGVSLKAGKGKAGANGSLTDFVFPEASTLNGNAENPATMGGGEKVCTCQAGLMSIGGVGAQPSTTGANGSKGGPSHGATGGEGGDPAPGDCASGSGGKKGANAPGVSSSSGATILGVIAATGWQPAGGLDGIAGLPGQGGGGGATFNAAGHGGGGGCGGCGGNGGTAGKGGGASLALVAFSAVIDLEASSLVTADAGDGGNGAVGQLGQQDIGGGGGSISTANSCAGGAGGKGGAGGAGGGGAGGISVGIVWKGAMAPTLSADTTVTNGKFGAKGIGGVPGTNDGVVGVAQKVLAMN